MESVIKNVWVVTIVNNEAECANRIIVYETGTHKAVVVSAWQGWWMVYFFIMKCQDCPD